MTDHQQIREALELSLKRTDLKYEHPFIRQAFAALSRLEAAAAADHIVDAGKMVPELSREDVVRLAREAGFGVGHAEAAITLFQRFASLVRSVPVGEVKPVAQWRKVGTSQWWDGYPDYSDGGGPYQTRTLYTTPPAPPEGWKLVPVEPTEAMLMAGEAEFRSYCFRHMFGHPAVWAAMLAAAPQPGDKP